MNTRETPEWPLPKPAEKPAHASRQHRLGMDALLIFVTIIWGGTFLPVQKTLQLTGPFTLLTLSFASGALTLALLFPRRLRRLTRFELGAGSIIGILLFAGYALQTIGLLYATTSMAGFLTGLYVPGVPLLSILLLRQWPTWEATVGILLSFLGLLLLSITNQFRLSFGLGELLLLGCALSFALQIVSISKFAPNADPTNLTIVQITVTAVLSFIAWPIAREPFVPPPLVVWGSTLFLGIVSKAFALVVMNRVQKVVSGVRATLIYALEPVWTALFGWLAGERLGPRAWIGCGCILLAMVIGSLHFRALTTRVRWAWWNTLRHTSHSTDRETADPSS